MRYLKISDLLQLVEKVEELKEITLSEAPNHSRINLLDLPKEIRLEIYEHIVGHPAVLMSLNAKQENFDLQLPPAHEQTQTLKNGQFLRTCKVINQEATPIWFNRTTFIIRTMPLSHGCCAWTCEEQFLGPGIVDQTTREQIRHVILSLILPHSPGHDRDHARALASLTFFLKHCNALQSISFEIEIATSLSAAWPAELAQLCAERGIHGPSLITAVAPKRLSVNVPDMWPTVKWKEMHSGHTGIKFFHNAMSNQGLLVGKRE